MGAFGQYPAAKHQPVQVGLGLSKGHIGQADADQRCAGCMLIHAKQLLAQSGKATDSELSQQAFPVRIVAIKRRGADANLLGNGAQADGTVAFKAQYGQGLIVGLLVEIAVVICGACHTDPLLQVNGVNIGMDKRPASMVFSWLGVGQDMPSRRPKIGLCRFFAR